MTKAAQSYRDNLEDRKVLFLYGIPSEVKQQLQTEEKILSSIQGYEVAFHRYNFLHLTGVRSNKSGTASAIFCFFKRWFYRAEIRYIGKDDAYKKECNNDWGVYR